VVLAAACSQSANRSPAPPPPDPLAHLRAFEETKRAEARFLETTPQDRAFGADPYDIAALPDGRAVGILRGRDELVLLGDVELREEARIATPRSPSAVAVYDGPSAGSLRTGDVLVASEIEPLIAHYRIDAGPVQRLADLPLAGVTATRALATGREGAVYVVEEHQDRLVTLALGASGRIERSERRLPRGPIRLARTRHALFVASLIDHAISAFALDARGVPSGEPVVTRIDGPFWGLAAIDVSDGGALVVAGGAEDHPLDRTGGFFGYVDSFVHAYRWNGKTRELRRTASINVSEQGLIVPKAIAFGFDGSALVTSYGGAKAALLSWKDGEAASPFVSSIAVPPGNTSIVRTRTGFLAANPLLDAWVALPDSGGVKVVRAASADSDTRTDRERLGEALFFTGLMAPASSSDGAKSRFSCETCHFEGYVDGRIHHTGRGDIHATTKPLVGLFNNRPHFSRALDPDLSAVAENEFKVAGAPAAADPHFDVDVRDVPWLANLGLQRQHYDSAELRLSLMSFLMSWTHRTNPRSATARSFTAEERAGAAQFRERCEGCHQARASADDPSSRVAFERWEELVFAGRGPLVWGSDAYEKTGIVPYVHEQGARVPSLRRLYKKRPYFTNGSAPDIATVLHRVRVLDGRFSHDESLGGTPLDETTARAIAAFVDLL
jgi:mono/diheme cytochrome c family protein